MTHIIILSHFICITIGSILFYELLRKAISKNKQRLLVIGIGMSNVSFILDTINIYCRHWYKGYQLNGVISVICELVFILSLLILILYLIRQGKQELYPQKRSTIIVGSIFILCQVFQLLSNSIPSIQVIPWACIGYLFFCGVQFTYLFHKKEIEKSSEVNENNVIAALQHKDDTTSQIVVKQSYEIVENEGIVSNKKDEMMKSLTARELEIAQCICEGKNNKEIAEALFISQNTVRNHIYNIYKKLDVKNKVELIKKLDL